MLPDRWERFTERERGLITMGLTTTAMLTVGRRDPEEPMNSAEELSRLLYMRDIVTLVTEISHSLGVEQAFEDPTLLPRLNELIAQHERGENPDPEQQMDLLDAYVRSAATTRRQ